MEDIELEGIELIDIEFNFMNLVDVEDCTFEDCHFYCATLVNADFAKCTFLNCVFEEATDFQSCNFLESKFKGLKFIEVDFNQVGFTESTHIEDCHFENSNLIGDLFHTIEIHRTTFHLVHINQTTFHKCFFNQSKILDSNIYKTSFWDTSFVDCEWKDIVNDFAELNDPIALCLFLETTIENVNTPDDFAKWNGVNIEPYLFYRRIIKSLQDAVKKYALDSVDNLAVVKDTLNRLSQIGEPEPKIKRAITNIFSQYFNLAKEQKDLDAFGSIATYFSQMPQEWLLNVGQFLPSPPEIRGESTLRLDFQTIGLSLAQTSNIFRKLDGLEIQFVGEQNRSAQIRDLQVGSIIIEIGSNIETIVLLVYVLVIHGYKGVNLFLDFQKKVRGNKKLKLETIPCSN